VIVVQQSAKSLASLNRSMAVGQIDLGSDQLIAESLMISFQMVMRHEFSDCCAQRAFTDENQSVQARLFDCSHKAFGVGVQVR